MTTNRRLWLQGALAATATLAMPHALAQSARTSFEQWIEAFRGRAIARGVSERTYNRVMTGLKPDTRVYALQAAQPEFQEETWQYLNRRVSDWRMITGKEKAREHAALLSRIEQDHGVDRTMLLALWGVESAYGDPLVQRNHMRPVFPALAALAWGEPRRRPYWEKEFLNALLIVEKGWGSPDEMRGSWAGAMGHTQWMPEVWLNVGIDYDGDGRVSPFGKPDDALASTARYLIERGKYRRGEHWGYEVRAPGQKSSNGMRTIAAWQTLGVTRANGQPFPNPNAAYKLWIPALGGPALLIGQNFQAIRSYNSPMNYALAIAHLSDRLRGDGPFVVPFPGSERTPTLTEVKEIQQRLTNFGFDTGGIDGRIGNDTMLAVRNFQRKVGIDPDDGYAGLKVLERLRQGS